MMKLLSLFRLNTAFLVILFFASISVRAQITYRSDEEVFNYSTQLTLQKRYLESAKILRSLILKDPKKSIYWFNFANNLFMLKRFTSAQKYYDRVILLNTKFVNPAKLYKVKTMAALGQLNEAVLAAENYKNENAGNKFFSMFENEIARLKTAQQQINLAVESYRKSDYESAANIFLSLEEGTNSGDGALLLALTYSKLNQLPLCSKLLAQTRQQMSLDSEQVELLNAIAERCRFRPSILDDLVVGVISGIGYSDNIFAEGNSVDKISSPILKLNVAAEYSALENNLLNIGYSLNLENPTAAVELSTLTHNFMMRSMREVDSNINLDGRFVFEIQNWNSTNELQSVRLDANANYKIKEYNYGAGIFYDTKSTLSGTNGFLSGSEVGISPYVAYVVKDLNLRGSLTYKQDMIGDIKYGDGSSLPLAHNGIGITLSSDFNLMPDQIIGGQLRMENRRYKNPEALTQEIRTDQELGLSIFWGLNLLPSLKINATIESTKNSSTLGEGEVRDKNYNVNTIFLSLSWDAW